MVFSAGDARHAAAHVKRTDSMDSDKQRSKIDAIYNLREAVESKVRAEQKLESDASPDARDELLAAQLEVEAKTQDAIDICHECGHEHAHGTPHIPSTSPSTSSGSGDPRVSGRQDNVVHVDFRRESESA